MASSEKLGDGETATVETKVSAPEDDSPYAETLNDAVAGTSAQREMWLFLNAVPAAKGLRVYGPKYELLSVGLVIVLLVEDVILSVKEVGDVVNSWPATKWFEYFAYVVFTSEYLLRIWSCMASKAINDGSCRAAICGRIHHGLSGLLLVDFVVLGAFYLQLYVDMAFSAKSGSKLQGLQVLRMFRAFRAFRSAKMLKVDRKANSLGILFKVLEAEVTPIMATLTIAFMLVIILATLMYYMENGAQPDKYSSIPASMWWSVTALTSVGYGDVFPITVGGKFLGCFACLFGSAIIALPTGILSNGFNEQIAKQSNEEEAELIEESVLETTHKLDTLCREVEGLHTALDNMDLSQQQLIRAFRQKFPERVREILGEAEEKEVLTASQSMQLTAADLESLREKVERDVAALKKKRKSASSKGVFLRPGMTIRY